MVDEKKQKNADEKSTEKKSYPNVYLVDYTIKDLTLGKIVETSVNQKEDYSYTLYNGPRPFFEDIVNTFPKVIDAIKGMKTGEEKLLKLSPKDAYGIRDKALLRVVPTSVFAENKIRPIVGLTINTGSAYGTIRSVSGGRVMVDFNSPYADHDIEFKIKYLELLEGTKKAESIIKEFLKGLEFSKLNYNSGKITISVANLKESKSEELNKLIKTILSKYMDVESVTINTA